MRLTRWAAVAVVAAVGVAGCGNDKPSAAEKAFCNSLVNVDKVSSPGGPGEDPVQANKEFGSNLAAPLATLAGQAPASLKSDVAAVDAIAKKAATGDTSASDGYGDAKNPIEKWAFDNCDFNTLSVTAKDFSYSGLPGTMKAGTAAIQLKNDGKQPHIMLWLTRKDGDTRPAPEVIGAAFAANDFSQFIGGDPAGAGPGQTGGITMEVPKGKYIVFCPIGNNGNDDDPHFAHGMHAEVTVN